MVDQGGLSRSHGADGGPLSGFRELDRLLRGELTTTSRLRAGGLEIAAGRITLCNIALAMVYGACMGTFGLFRERGPSVWQIVACVVKVPLLFYLTLLVTLPSLYVFNALVGSRLSVAAVVRLLVASVGVIVTVLASLGPIVAFFSVSTTSYPFMVVFNVVVFAVSGALGLMFLLQTLQRLTLEGPAVAVAPASGPAFEAEAGVASIEGPSSAPSGEAALESPMGQGGLDASGPSGPAGQGPLEPLADRALSQQVRTIFRVWVVVFGLVGAQMGWVLRPFIGSPDLPFSWFRPRESNFFQAFLRSLAGLFS